MNLEKIFAALGNKTRLNIVKFIGSKERACKEVVKRFPLSQPTLSHHLGKLFEAGIITMRQEGNYHFYKLNIIKLNSIGLELEKLIKSK